MSDRDDQLLRLARRNAAKIVADKWAVAENDATDTERAIVNARQVLLGNEEHEARVVRSQDEQDEVLARRYRTSPPSAEELYEFCVDVLGYKLLRPQPHDEQCRFYVSVAPSAFPNDRGERQYGMILVPRDTFKSTIGCIGLILYMLVKNPNLAFLIGGHRHDIAKKRLASVKRNMARKRFQKLFGDWIPKFREEIWNEDSIVITMRDSDDASVQVDPTVDTCGVDSPKEGGHFDFIILDDLVHKDNVQTPLMRQKTYEFIGRCVPMLKPGGSMLVIGTRWAHHDAYGKILRDDKKAVQDGLTPLYKTLIRGATLPDGSMYFPERLPQKELDRIRRTPGMTEYLFRSQYYNETIEDSEHLFPSIEEATLDVEFYVDPWSRNSIVEWGGKHIPVLVSMAWDTAGHKPTSQSDYHGLTVVGCDPVSNWWVLEGEQVKDLPNKVVEHVARRLIYYRPHTLSIEVVGQSGVWITLLRNYIIQKGLYMPYIYESRPPTNVGKLDRIDTTLQPLAEAKKLLICGPNAAHPTRCMDLINQMAEYPQVDHLDVVDSLAQHRLIVRPAESKDSMDFVDYDTLDYDERQVAAGGEDFRRRISAYAGRSSSARRQRSGTVALRRVK